MPKQCQTACHCTKNSDVQVLPSQPLPPKQPSRLADGSAPLEQTPVIKPRELGGRRFGVRGCLRELVALVVDVLVRRDPRPARRSMHDVHLIARVDLVALLPVRDERPQAGDPLQGVLRRICLQKLFNGIRWLAAANATYLEPDDTS